VSDRIAKEWLARLEASVGSDPGASGFPALAEVLRGAGRLQEAEDVARRGLERKPGNLEGTLVRALILLDRGRVDDARRELAARAGESLAASGVDTVEVRDSAAEAGEFDVEVTEGELDRAFDGAEPDRDQLVDADRVAQEAMHSADLDRPEGLPDPASDPVFATRTMAELLERQGDSEGASQIRTTLAAVAPAADEVGVGATRSGPPPVRERIIETLETWLFNLRSAPR
jgi:hypothetical protein